MRSCVLAIVRACVLAIVRACVRACVRAHPTTPSDNRGVDQLWCVRLLVDWFAAPALLSSSLPVVARFEHTPFAFMWIFFSIIGVFIFRGVLSFVNDVPLVVTRQKELVSIIHKNEVEVRAHACVHACARACVRTHTPPPGHFFGCAYCFIKSSWFGLGWFTGAERRVRVEDPATLTTFSHCWILCVTLLYDRPTVVAVGRLTWWSKACRSAL